MKTKEKPMFRVSHNRVSSYGKLKIELITRADIFDRCNASVELDWQSNPDTPRDWYGFRVSISAQSFNEMSFGQKLFRKAVPKGNENSEISPSTVVCALRKAGFKQCVYDSRLRDYVLIDEMPDSNLDLWLDGNSGNCQVNALARNEKEAKREVARQLANYSVEALEKWIADGKPVRLAQTASCPAVVNLDDILPQGESESAA